MEFRPYWSLRDLADRWGKRRQTVRYYVVRGYLHATQYTRRGAYVVTDAERIRFEREEQPALMSGPTPRQRGTDDA